MYICVDIDSCLKIRSYLNFIDKLLVSMDDKKTAMQKTLVSSKPLVDIAIFLSGIKMGKGDLLPLGTDHLDQLWNVIKYLQGDVRFECPDREKNKIY